MYYAKLRNVKFNECSPETFIKEELSKPINPLMAEVEKVSFIPNVMWGKGTLLLRELDEVMKEGEFRRIRKENLPQSSYLRIVCSRRKFNMDIMQRTVDGVTYLYFVKKDAEKRIQKGGND